ncbi:FecCD family ABC transporter permease [Salipiger profundus]|uniref:FecCD family ABC transporter permease n=1 Tax=Salipiger profundus TaxID=1229727 RepID=UPI0008F3073A|nr:iron ABC transporter permease [Salipiger profundus]SFD77402.1 iron complex transport system permease protein [Salipiger profundus]
MSAAADSSVGAGYRAYTTRKIVIVALLALALIPALIAALSLGPAAVPADEVARTLLGQEVTRKSELIVWNIRLPQALSAVAGAGAAMQSILRNPLGSRFTLGISQAAAFGAAFAVMVLGTGTRQGANAASVAVQDPTTTMIWAFAFSLIAAGIITLIARLRGAAPEVMVLTGVALGALASAGTAFLQFFADDIQLAAIVFWTFGDTARVDWSELAILSTVTGVACVYFLAQSWNYNAIDAGDETARGLGVRVDRMRIVGMVMASLLTAVSIAFLGIIGFVGLVVPHMVRRVIGADHRFLLPASIFGGGLLLLLSDTAARLILSPHVLPVSVLTAFMGAPVFIFLILRARR